jgi:asparagine synthase (glutamine-hydrolysing)
MCGIVGVASQGGGVDPEQLSRMRDTIRHRGPDDAGTWCSDDHRIGLALRRLAIIDLSPGGHQPMADSSGRLWICFNGEIYNYRELKSRLEANGHRFRTASDTEVILEAYRAWGTDCVRELNGMFAFGLYDADRDRLFLARDRAGEKPLFYRHASGSLCFASELKALLADPKCPRALDLESLEHYLAYGYVPGSRCILREFHKLPQGHAMRYDLKTDELVVWAYWTLPEPEGQPVTDPTELVSELERLLFDSVRLRMIADVPLGIMLSGGLDSSLVTAMAARVSSRPIKTFNISFPGHREDESRYARIVARHFGTEHVELAAEPATVDLLPELARQFDEPVADSSMVPTYVLSRLIRKEATVALGGDGGDELFGGYIHYDWILRNDRVGRLVPLPVRKLLGLAAEKLIPVGVRGRHYVIGSGGDLSRLYAHVNLYFDSNTRRRLLRPLGLSRDGEPERMKASLCSNGHTPLQQATEADFRSYLVDDILVKVDRTSMLTSLEVRAPWLDPRIIEMAFSRVPDSLRAAAAQRKILPKLLAKRLLPADLDLERKQGFSLPLGSWFRGDWGRFMESVLMGPEQRLFDRPTLRSLVSGQRSGLANTQRIFALTLFELWRREYGIEL